MVRDLEEEKRDRIEHFHLASLLILIFLISIIFIIFLFLSQGTEATDVSGHITSDTTWNASGNPYIVKENVYLDKGVHLTIQPGVIIKFDGYYYLDVMGNLNVKGNETHNVTFTKNDLNPSVTSWNGIRIKQDGSAYICDCSISNVYYGILIDRSSNITLMNTTIIDSTYGLSIAYSHDISIDNLTLYESYEGIHLSYSSNITIANSSVSNCYEGIYFLRSSNMTFLSVQFWDISSLNFHFDTDLTQEKIHYNHNIIDCKLNGKPLYYYFDIKNQKIENLEAGGMILAWSNNVTVNSCNITNGDGISLFYTYNSTILNCNSSDNYRGTFLYHSPGEATENYTVFNTISNNIVLNNTNGIRLSYSYYNLITDNEIIRNEYGLYLYQSNYNWIYHNNFIENEHQVLITGSYYWNYNLWDNGYEGNHWSDYPGSDVSGDGIGDSPYPISYYSSDYFPLIQPWNGSLPPDTVLPFFERNPIINYRNLMIPRDEIRIGFEASEWGHYEIIIDTDGTQGFDNTTDTILRGDTYAEYQYVFWNGQDNEGNYLEDGEYGIQVMIWDRAGNPILEPYDAGYVSTVKDMDGDGVIDAEDAFPNDPTESEDFDGDGIGDNSDTDWDNDGYPNYDDAFPWDGNEWKDSDDDGIGDNADTDDNDNGIPDVAEIPLALIILLIPIVTLILTNRYVKGGKEGEE